MKFINLLNKRILLPLADRYMSTEVLKYIRIIEKMSGWSASEIRDWQILRLKRLLTHAYQKTNYYRAVFDQLGILPSDINDIQDLKLLPVLVKNSIVDKPHQFIPANLSSFKYKHMATGGSTGDPMKFLLDHRSYSYVTAMRFYYLSKLGYAAGDKLLVLGGSSVVPDHSYALPYRLFYFFNRKTMLSSIDMSDTVIEKYIRIINRKKIEYIYGSPSVLFLFACFMERNRLTIPSVKGFISTSEMLLDHYRRKIEAVFKCTVMDVYGACDGGLATYESAPGTYSVGYNCIVEIEQEKTLTGNILVTDLLNYAFPFIRYKLGDQISLQIPTQSKKQYNGQMITHIWGRNSEIMKLENGITLTGKGFPTLFSQMNVRAYRIRKIGYLHIECQIEKSRAYSNKEEEIIKSAFKKHAGADCKLSISYVDKLHPLPNGKHNFYIAENESV